MHDKHQAAIWDKVCDTIASVSAVDRSQLLPSTALLQDLDLDSLALYEIVIELETHYELQISDEEIESLRTLSEVVDFIAKRTGPSKK